MSEKQGGNCRFHVGQRQIWTKGWILVELKSWNTYFNSSFTGSPFKACSLLLPIWSLQGVLSREKEILSSKAECPGAIPMQNHVEGNGGTCFRPHASHALTLPSHCSWVSHRQKSVECFRVSKWFPHPTERQGARTPEALMDSHNNTCYTCQPSQ